MKGYELMINYIGQFYADTVVCLSGPASNPLCAREWTWVAMLLAITGSWVIVYAMVKYHQHKKAYQVAMKAEAYRQSIAEPEIMKEHRWKGDDVGDSTDDFKTAVEDWRRSRDGRVFNSSEPV